MKTKSLLLALAALFGSASSASAASFLTDYIDDVSYRFYLNNALTQAPTGIILIVGALLTVGFLCYSLSWANDEFDLTDDILGREGDNGMRRIWVFNYQPYVKVGTVFLTLLVSFIAAVLTIVLVGVAVFGVMWIIKIFVMLLIWAGYIAVVLGILALIGKEGAGCGLIIFGGLIVNFEKPMTRFGNNIVEWGFSFMQDLNLFQWIYGLFTKLWDAILLILATPFILFAAIALTIIVLVLLLMGIEWLVMRIYGISRPCGGCGSTATPDYLINGHVHPVGLHPGVYGVFYQTNPDTGQKVPTMFFNGKGKLDRVCKNCGKRIVSDGEHTIGTEIHVGIVGNRSSGKSYLIYSGLDQLQQKLGKRIEQVSAESDTRIKDNAKRIATGAGIQTQDKNAYYAIQLMLERKLNPIPYHLFFYDVAGEKFNLASESSRSGLDFYKNVQTIVFILDPTMIDYNQLTPSQRFDDWLDKGHRQNETYAPEQTFSKLKQILERNGRKLKNIDLAFVCTKSDIGYLDDLGIASDANSLRAFVVSDLGMRNLVNAATAEFNTVSYHAVSVFKPGQAAGFLQWILEQRGVKF